MPRTARASMRFQCLTLSGVAMVLQSLELTEAAAEIAPLSQACAGHAATVIDGSIYVICRGRLDVYSPKTNTWKKKADPPTARAFHAAAGLNGKLYVIGGFLTSERGEKCPAAVERYNPATDNWASATDLPAPRSRLAAVVRDGKIVVLGGIEEKTRKDSNCVDIYDPQTNRWTAGPSLPEAAHGLDAAVIGDRIHVLIWDKKHWALNGDKWKLRAEAPSMRLFSASGVVGGKLYTMGGRDGIGVGVWEYDPAKNAWARKRDMPTSRNRFAAATVAEKIYALGGSGPLRNVESFDPAADRWEK